MDGGILSDRMSGQRRNHCTVFTLMQSLFVTDVSIKWVCFSIDKDIVGFGIGSGQPYDDHIGEFCFGYADRVDCQQIYSGSVAHSAYAFRIE